MEKPFVYDDFEMDKVARFLDLAHVEYKRAPLYEGEQIACEDWDVVCHKYSYGGERGLLETYGDIVPADWGDDVEGYMTAADVILRFMEMRERA